MILGKAMLYWGCSLKSQIFGQRVAETMCGPCGDRTAKTLPNTANANGEEFLHVEYTFGYCTPNLWFNSQHDSHTIICDLLIQYINRYVFTSCYHMFHHVSIFFLVPEFETSIKQTIQHEFVSALVDSGTQDVILPEKG